MDSYVFEIVTLLYDGSWKQGHPLPGGNATQNGLRGTKLHDITRNDPAILDPIFKNAPIGTHLAEYNQRRLFNPVDTTDLPGG